MQTLGCPKVVDVFATRPDAVSHATQGTSTSIFSKSWTGAPSTLATTVDKHILDERFVASVMNVYIDPVTATNDATRKAVITTDATEFVMWAFPVDGESSYDATVRMSAVKKGDLVRIGHAPEGSVDYLTVIDKIEAPVLYNSLASAVAISISGTTLASGADTSASPYTKAGRVVLRLSKKVQLTAIPTPFYSNASVASTSQVQLGTSGTTRKDGQFGTVYKASDPVDTFADTFKDYLYPFYHCVPAPVEFGIKFDRALKDVKQITLMAYSLEAKSQTDVTNADVLPIDDYYILTIDEVQGEVLSNHMKAHKAFAVLSAGGFADSRTFYNAQYPDGIISQSVNMKHVSSLTFKLTSRQGDPAQVGRVHLWLKLHTLHG